MSTFKVLITDHVWPTTEPEETVLMEEADAEAMVAPDGSEDTLVSLAGDVDAIMTCFAQVTPAVLQAAPNCVAVGRFGVGVDNIAVDTATELGMAVTYVPDYCVDEVSDHVMAILLTWNRRVSLFDNSVKGDGWGSLGLTMRMMRPERQDSGGDWIRTHRSGRCSEGTGLRLPRPCLRPVYDVRAVRSSRSSQV